METNNTKNFFNIKNTGSTTTSLNALEDIEELPDGQAYIWLRDELLSLVDYSTLKEKLENSKDIMRIRYFNETSEYHFWRIGNTLKGRLRIDDDSGGTKETPYIETTPFLRGKALPAGKQTAKAKAKIRVRHYLTTEGQAGYIDMRICKIIDLEK